MVRARLTRTIAAVSAVWLAALCSGFPTLPTQVELLQTPNQPTSTRATTPKSGQQRTVEHFGFEEPNNPYPVPQYWVRLVDTPATPRPGFPPFNEAAFDFDVAHSGHASLRLPSRGGSTSLRLLPGTIPIFPQGDYSVSGFIRTKGVNVSRAYLTARFLDQNQRLVPGGEVRSPAIVSEDGWTPITVDLIGLRDDVAFLQIELQLLQPQQQPALTTKPNPALAAHTVPVEDLSASAWFDDITISQIPRVEITSTHVGNTFASDDPPTLVMTIRDLVGEQLLARLRAIDIDGRIADSASIPVDASGRPIQWKPSLTQPGWYTILLDVTTDDRVLTRESTAIVWLPRRTTTPSTELARFGLHADRAELWQYPALTAIHELLGFGHITLPVWGDQDDSSSIPAAVESIGATLDQLLARGQSVTLCMPRLPSDLAAKHSLDPSDPLSIALADQKDWVPFMNPAFDRYGQRITRWLIGRVASRASLPGEGGDEAFWSRSLPDAVERLHTSLSLLVPGPHISIPWRSDLDLTEFAAGAKPASRPAGAMMFVPSWADRVPIEFFRREYERLPQPRPELTLMPQLPPSASSEADRVVTLSRQIVECWREFADPTVGDPAARMSVNAPMTIHGTRRRHVAPTPDAAVWAALSDRLAGRRIVGEYPAPEGVRCYILAPLDSLKTTGNDAFDRTTPSHAADEDSAHTGALVLWNESADPTDAYVYVYTPADHARLIDPIGRSIRLNSPDPRHPSDAIQRVHATPMPIFVEGIDARLARLIASFQVTPEFLPAVAIEHQLEMRLTNPWPTSLTGRLQIVPPGSASSKRGSLDAATGRPRKGWTIAPDGIIPINIPPGQTQVIPFSATLPPAEDAGTKQVGAILRLDSDQHLAPIRLEAPIDIGLEDIGLVAKGDLVPNIDGPNAVITLQIVNRGQAERLLRLQVRVPGLPTRELVLANPPPGETITKRFVYKDAADHIRGKRIRVSITDAESASRLNTTLIVP